MKKIIVAFDGLRYSESAQEYAIQIAKSNGAHLVGVFLDDFLHHSYKIYELVNENGDIEINRQKYEARDMRERAEAVKEFESACSEAGVNFSIHHDRNIALQELIHESIYADLLVMDNSETYGNYPDVTPGTFVRDLLSGIECPILLVPHKFVKFTKLALLYDGKPSSVFAIRMFSYLLPELKKLPAEVVTVKEKELNAHVPDNYLMKEFMKRHFPDAYYSVLKGDPETEIVNHLQEMRDDPLVILGAYKRGMVSRWFKESMADVLLRQLRTPLFIAHN